MKERRKQPRDRSSEVEILQLVTQEGKKLSLKVVDHSGIGLGVELIHPLALGSIGTVTGEFRVDGQPRAVKQQVQVVRCEEVRPGVFHVGLNLESGAFHEAPRAAGTVEEVADYYEVLQVHNRASADTIHRVYRILAQRYHPDNPETGSADLFKQVLDAYKVLSDPEKRAEYDVHLGQYTRQKWKIFDQPSASVGVDGEKNKRKGILAILYNKRLTQPHSPTLTLPEMEDVLGVPRDHLEFSLWYLKENGWIQRGDNAKFLITAKGVDQAEEMGAWAPPRKDHLLEAGKTA